MLFNFPELIRKHNLQFTGVIHIGAHFCGEIKDYCLAKIPNAILIEADPFIYEHLKNAILYKSYSTNSYPITYSPLDDSIKNNTKFKVYNYAMYNKDNQEIEFNIANFDGGTNSLLKINEYGTASSWAPYKHVKTIKVPTKTLDSLMKEQEENYNFINIDVEGAELIVMEGAKEILKSIDYIMAETQDKLRFEGSCLRSELTEFLSKFGFYEADYYDTGKLWGDSLYIKK